MHKSALLRTRIPTRDYKRPVPGEECVVCGEKRWVEKAHFPSPKRSPWNGEKWIWLCPTHHRLLDNGRLSKKELETIWRKGFQDVPADRVEEFLKWAFDQGYPYDFFKFPEEDSI